MTSSFRKMPFILAATLLFGTLHASAQLNENCTVSVLNRTTQARADGSWILPSVPANAGQVRARATCVENGVTRSGQSDLFVVPVNGVVDNVQISFNGAAPIPVSLTLTPSLAMLGAVGATSQLNASAVYADFHAIDVTAGTAGTTYFTSNPAIATVDENGLVTARSTGTVLLSAMNEGTLGMTRITISTTGDSDGDGMPDDYELANGLDPNNPADAQLDPDGDGLKNIDEFHLGTNPRLADTDGDGIPDGEEVVLGADGFITNPLLADTDGDGLSDGLEVQTGSDPTNRNSYNLARALRTFTVAPTSVTLIVNTLVGQAYTQLTVTGTLLDGNTIDLTSTSRGTNYGSSELAIANFGSPDGRVFAGGEGTATITVTNSTFSGTVNVIVRNFTPLPLSSIAIPGYANNVKVKDNYAFVAAGSGGLQVVNVTNPQAPVLAGSRSTNGNANDIRIVGNLAYVANGTAGLAILDISNPVSPVLVGSVSTGGEAMDVMVVNNVVYVANGTAGLTIVNASNAAAPIVVSTLHTGGTARGVDISGNYAVVADDSPSSALRVIDVSTPTSPHIVGNLTLSGSPKDVRAAGSIAYLAAYTGGMQIVDFSTPSSPRLVGSLPGSFPGGFVPRDVDVVGQFAIFAEQLFLNAVPFVDITTPSAPLFKGIIDFYPLGDYAGTGIATNGAYVYMTGEATFVSTENGSSGNTRLFIGQYLPLEDHAGNPPHISITAPADGSTQIEGDTVTVTADATDDVAVGLVSFSVDGQQAFTDTSAPYEYVLTIPLGVHQLVFGATATDLGANAAAAANVTVNVIPDPLTTVTGRVVGTDGNPIAGAAVSTNGDATATTAADGTFVISGVTTIRGSIIVQARFTNAQGLMLIGSSSPTTAVRGGTTAVGTITAVSAVWENNLGSVVGTLLCDDCFQSFPLPFPFPFYNGIQTTAWVGSNGYITFGAGDRTYDETVPVFASLPRIAAFFDDLDVRRGSLYVNATLPDRFVVTWVGVPHFPQSSTVGTNTLQMILFTDGRVQFGYHGISSLTSGTIVGITPGPGALVQQLDFSATRFLDVAPNTSIFEYFLSASPFDLDGAFIVFTPKSGGAYSVQTILQPPPAGQFQVTTLNAAASLITAAVHLQSHSDATSQNPFAHAEVEVTSSRDRKFKRMANTDANGNFSIRNVPAGAVTLVVRKKGQIVGYGGVVIADNADASRPVQVEIAAPSQEMKSGPQP